MLTVYLRTPSPLKKSSSLSRELPVRALTLDDVEDNGAMSDGDPRDDYLEPKNRTTVGEIPQDHTPGLEPKSPTKSHPFSSTLDQGKLPPSSPAPVPSPTQSPLRPSHAPTSPVLGPTTSTQDTALSLTQYTQSVYPLAYPSQVSDFNQIFKDADEGESYPPDFPMSLRIVSLSDTLPLSSLTAR